jgi:hypothetical protein
MNKFNEDICLEQTYDVIVGKETLHTLMEGSRGVHLLFDPTYPLAEMDIEIFNILIDHFISTEEYEKCQKLIDLKKVLFS